MNKWIAVIGPLWLFAESLFAGQMVGNGGDPIRMRFWQAKEVASGIVLQVQEQAFADTVPQQTKEWIVANQGVLAADIVGSEHEWHGEDQATCAETMPTALSPLRLSLPTCGREQFGRTDIVQLLIHESVHHLGITDEAFADAVAVAIVRAWKDGSLHWFPLAEPGHALTGRRNHSAVWTGSEMIIFGGTDTNGLELNTGARFNRETGEWKPLSTEGAPARYGHVALWHAGKMIVWGGYETFEYDRTGWVADGAIYDPKTDSWTSIPSSLAGEAKVLRHWASQVAVGFDNKLFVWGGEESQYADAIGGIFDLETRRWSSISVEGAPLRQQGHQAVWTGSKILVWGGDKGRRNYTNEGAIYDPATNSWQAMNKAGAPSERVDHSIVWTGQQAIVFGGDYGSGVLEGTGGVYDPRTDRWRSFASEIAMQRTGHVAAWTGDEMLVIGGRARRSSTFLGTPLAFNPQTLAWRAVTTVGGPEGRYQASGVWADDVLIFWGGQMGSRDMAKTGGILFP